ncbi:MAG: monofunctional biosynthetic peptidoglycan transglycosylase [Thermodesulfobacteriota bacterium]
MKTRLIKIAKWIRDILIGCAVATLVPVILFRFVPVPVTPLMIIRCFEQIHNDQKLRLSKDWVPLKKISPNMVAAVIASEDQNFVRHFGFDIESIEKAYDQNRRGRRIKGASTITMQTAKNLFLWPDRSWLRKGLEAYFTVLLEICWSKERIIEVYLNIVETGRGIYGVEAAANAYYKKPAAKLSRREAAMIAAALPLPLRMNPARPSSYMISRQEWILHQMYYIDLGPMKLKK